MADTENPGLCDETLDIFGEFMTMVEETSNLPDVPLDWTPVLEVFGPVEEVFGPIEEDDVIFIERIYIRIRNMVTGVPDEGFETFLMIVGWLILVLIGFFTICLILFTGLFRSPSGIQILIIMFKLRNILILVLLSILVLFIIYVIIKDVGTTIFGFFREYFNNLN